MEEETMTQNDRLTYLLEAFKDDSEYRQCLTIPEDLHEKRRLLRSLMNVRMPHAMSQKTIDIQDSYLKERAVEKGIVRVEEIPEIQNGISIWQGDITRLQADAIVNAANAQMLGCFQPCHGCIDNCIHTYAGIELRNECGRKMNQLRKRFGQDYEQPTGIPMLTEGYNLPAKKVIHVVGPIVYDQLTSDLEDDLRNCYQNSLDLCAENHLKTVAFCCISTGVFRFPNQRAAEIAYHTVKAWMKEHSGIIDRVIFNVFKDEDKDIYEELIQNDA